MWLSADYVVRWFESWRLTMTNLSANVTEKTQCASLLSMAECLAKEASYLPRYVWSNGWPFITDIMALSDDGVERQFEEGMFCYPSSRFSHMLLKQILQIEQTELSHRTYHVGISADDFQEESRDMCLSVRTVWDPRGFALKSASACFSLKTWNRSGPFLGVKHS
jgi:hypothetical protein